MNLKALIYRVLLFLSVFLPLWLGGVAPGAGWSALLAALPPALSMAYFKMANR